MNIKQLNEKLAKFFEDQDQNEFDSEEYYVYATGILSKTKKLIKDFLDK